VKSKVFPSADAPGPYKNSMQGFQVHSTFRTLQLLAAGLVIAACDAATSSSSAGEGSTAPVAKSSASAVAQLSPFVPNPASVTSDAPVALFVHGGGWTAGDANTARFLQPRFAAWGIRLETAEYRQIPQVELGTSIEDVRAAIQRLRGSSRRPLIVIGHSAGAHLAAAAVLGADNGQPTCLVLLDGVGYDLPRLLQERPGLQRRLHLTPTNAQALSPMALIDPKDTAVQMLVAAGNDARKTRDEGEVLAEAAQRQGLRATFLYYPEMAHADFIRAFRDSSSRFVADVDRFVQGCAR
jgi:arylformamidase